MTSHNTSIACAALLAALPACGSNSSDTGGESPLSVEEAPLLLEAALGSLSVRSAMLSTASTDTVTNLELPRPVYDVLKNFGVAALPNARECVTRTSDWIDADGDGIPVDFTVEFGCHEQKLGEMTADVLGNVRVDDNNDMNPISGYVAEWTGFGIDRVFASGQIKRFVLDGSSSLELAAGSLNLVEDYLAHAEVENDDGVFFGKLQGANILKFTPDDDTNPLDAGEIAYLGESRFENNQGAHRLGVGTDPILHFDSACQVDHPDRPGWDSGAVIFEDGARLRIEYRGCDENAATLDGVSIGQL